jgi:hypothetical protein
MMLGYIPVFAIMVAAHVLATDYAWLERLWISDKTGTAEANPNFEILPEETKTKYLNLFGKMKWDISGGVSTPSYPKGRPSVTSTVKMTP